MVVSPLRLLPFAYLVSTHPSSFLISAFAQQQRSMTTTTTTTFTKPVVQYIFVRRDLDWPSGAIAAQVAHASVAAIVEGTKANDAATLHYTEDLLHMTKYVYGVDSLAELESVQAVLASKLGGLDDTERPYHYWIEEPEHIPTAVATWPIERTNKVSKLVKNLKVSFL